MPGGKAHDRYDVDITWEKRYTTLHASYSTVKMELSRCNTELIAEQRKAARLEVSVDAARSLKLDNIELEKRCMTLAKDMDATQSIISSFQNAQEREREVGA